MFNFLQIRGLNQTFLVCTTCTQLPRQSHNKVSIKLYAEKQLDAKILLPRFLTPVYK